jgi:hypothetical protein
MKPGSLIAVIAYSREVSFGARLVGPSRARSLLG